MFDQDDGGCEWFDVNLHTFLTQVVRISARYNVFREITVSHDRYGPDLYYLKRFLFMEMVDGQDDECCE